VKNFNLYIQNNSRDKYGDSQRVRHRERKEERGKRMEREGTDTQRKQAKERTQRKRKEKNRPSKQTGKDREDRGRETERQSGHAEKTTGRQQEKQTDTKRQSYPFNLLTSTCGSYSTSAFQSSLRNQC